MTKILSPLAAAFTQPSTEEKFRLIGASAGEPGSRKTSFWLEAPGPIAVFSLDQGLEGVVQRQLRENPGKEIWVKEYDWSPRRDVDLQAKAIELRDQFEEHLQLALKHARSLLFDKEGDFWELYRYAEFGPAQNDAPRNYPALNQRYREFVNAAKSHDCNVGFISGMKELWGMNSNNKLGATGKRVRAGFGDLGGLVHVEMMHTGLSPNDWNIHIGKARGPEGWKYAGQDVGNLTFPEVGMLIFPDSQPEDWE